VRLRLVSVATSPLLLPLLRLMSKETAATAAAAKTTIDPATPPTMAAVGTLRVFLSSPEWCTRAYCSLN
jgi:hypothetical protein